MMAQKNTNPFKKLMEISSGWAVDSYRCPECGFELECYDGDNLEAMEQDFDDFRETLSIDASLLDFRCNQCSERYFLVMLSVIQATDLSDAWVNKYFWQNERQEEEERNITVDWQESMKQFPPLCPASVTELKEGRLFRFWLGPEPQHKAGPRFNRFFEWGNRTLCLFLAKNFAQRSLPLPKGEAGGQ